MSIDTYPWEIYIFESVIMFSAFTTGIEQKLSASTDFYWTGMDRKLFRQNK